MGVKDNIKNKNKIINIKYNTKNKNKNIKNKKIPYLLTLKKISTNVSKEISPDFLEFTKINCCYYCGNKVLWIPNAYKGTFKGYNLDRMNSSIGYTKENCVVCCKICNIMKRTYGHDYFLSHIKKIAKNKSL